jgi:CHASE2 domain-containing sensor protein
MLKKIKTQNHWKVGLVFLVSTTLILLAREGGFLQAFEWLCSDFFFQIRPLESPDQRIVIVEMTELDIRRYEYPVSDRNLARLIKKIQAQSPHLIGLDLVRDRPEEPGHEELTEVLKTTPNLLGVEKVFGDEKEKIAAPPMLKKLHRVAIADVSVDSDGFLRRGLFYFRGQGDRQNIYYSLGAHLALAYLQEKGTKPETIDDYGMRLGKVDLYPLKKNDGGYQNVEDWGAQFLINFRNPLQSFQRVSFSQVLENQTAPNLFKDKIVLIGMTAVSVKDEFYTPFSRSLNSSPKPIHGVEIQANLASHIISAVLDGRAIINIIPNPRLEWWFESFFIGFWGLITAIFIWGQRKTPNYLILTLKASAIVVVLISLLLIGSYIAFSYGWWLPLFPSILEVVIIFIGVFCLILDEKNQKLSKLNQKLNELNQELKLRQQQMMVERRQAAIAAIAAGIAHQVNNPLAHVIDYAYINLDRITRLREKIQQLMGAQPNALQPLPEEIFPIVETIERNTDKIFQQGNRAAKFIDRLLRQPRAEESEPMIVNVNELITSTSQLVIFSKKKRANDYSLQLKVNNEAEIGERKIFAEDLTEILINLLTNACDAVFEKKGRMGGTFQPAIYVDVKICPRESNRFVITVKDNGDGIAPDIAKHISEPFRTTKPLGKGTGLGLHMTYEFVRKRGGEIFWLREGEFTSFVVAFPWLVD